MNTRILVVTLLAGSFLATPAWAGSPSSPEVTDATGDVAIAQLDVQSMWITSTPTQVIFTFKLRDLAEPSPAFANGHSNYYRAEFTRSTNGARYFVEGQIHAVDTSSTLGLTLPRFNGGVAASVGTNFQGGAVGGGDTLGGTVEVDPAADTVTVKVNRGSIFASGVVLSQITVATYENDLAFEINNPNIANALGGIGARTTIDSATGSRSYTVA